MWQQAVSIDLDNIYSSHDDRVDALGLGLDFLKQQLAVSEEDVNKEYKQKLFDHELENIIHSHSFVRHGVSKHTINQVGNFGNTLGGRRGRR